jgi:WhiB family redox-sensing transcriptional regulator
MDMTTRIGMRRDRSIHDRTWVADALCRHTDIDFYPPDDRDGPRGPSKLELRAIAVCQHCPVVFDCLAYALDADERYGVWGGLTAQQRGSMKRDGRRRWDRDTHMDGLNVSAATYKNHGCRCDGCRADHINKKRNQRQNARTA